MNIRTDQSHYPPLQLILTTMVWTLHLTSYEQANITNIWVLINHFFSSTLTFNNDNIVFICHHDNKEKIPKAHGCFQLCGWWPTNPFWREGGISHNHTHTHTHTHTLYALTYKQTKNIGLMDQWTQSPITWTNNDGNTLVFCGAS